VFTSLGSLRVVAAHFGLSLSERRLQGKRCDAPTFI